MTINYTPRSKADLDGVAEYYNTIDPQIFPRMLNEILAVLARIERHPWSGKPQHVKAVRKVVAKKFEHVIYYRYRVRTKSVEVLRVVHGRQKRPFADN